MAKHVLLSRNVRIEKPLRMRRRRRSRRGGGIICRSVIWINNNNSANVENGMQFEMALLSLLDLPVCGGGVVLVDMFLSPLFLWPFEYQLVNDVI